MAATLAAPLAANGLKMATASLLPHPESTRVRESKGLYSELRPQFHNLGRVFGTDGPKLQQLVATSPSVMNSAPLSKPFPYKSLKCSDCAPPFFEDCSTPKHDSTHNVKVLGGGGKINMSVKAGTSLSSNEIEPPWRCIVLDIEGTTTPISFVTDVLFPYARDNVGRHLSATYETAETRDDINLLRSQVEDDLEKEIVGAVPIPSDDAGKDEVIAALVADVEGMIRADRKITALKQLQGHIWRTGFQNNELESVVFDDVPEALAKWHALGIKVYIYSSGSRLAQRLIFGNSNYGDMRKYLSGFFDTTVGNKKETRSYTEISESLGVDNPSEILFVTDVFQEAVAAKAAGLEVRVSIRPGNGPLPENHGFKTINSFLEI